MNNIINFTLNDLKPIDYGIFLNFLFSMGVEVEADQEKYSKTPNEKDVPVDYFGHVRFPEIKAREIIEKLFSQSERDKLANLMNEFNEKEPLLMSKARLEKESELNVNRESLTYRVFQEVEKQFSSDALDLLGLIRIKPNHFKESYTFLAEMWTNLSKKENERSRGYTTAQIKEEAVLKALDELENFITHLKSTEQNPTKGKDKTKKLSSQEIKEYCKTNQKIIEKELERELVKEKELDVEIQTELKKLRKGEVNDQNEVDEIKNRISNNIKLKKAEKELDHLLNSCKKKMSPKMRKRLLQKINDFTKKNDSFYQQVFQKRKKKIEKMIKRLETDNYSQQLSSSENNFFLAAKSLIGGYSLMTLFIIFKKMPKLRK